MEVISYIPYGFICKLTTTTDEKIESIKFKCSSTKQEFEWQELLNNTSDNGTASYETKLLNEHTMLLKIQNLKCRESYQISLQTNYRHYEGEATVPGTVKPYPSFSLLLKDFFGGFIFISHFLTFRKFNFHPTIWFFIVCLIFGVHHL